MVLDNSYYFTSKIEIKPQLPAVLCRRRLHYFTSKIEIKPQLLNLVRLIVINYFTSKIEIKPQLHGKQVFACLIILHQK